MMDSGAAISRGWAFVKSELWAAQPFFEASFEGLVFIPEIEDGFFELREINFAVYRSEHA